MLILTYGLSENQKIEVAARYDRHCEIHDVTKQYQDLLAVGCDLMIVNPKALPEEGLASLKEVYTELEEDELIPLFLTEEADIPKTRIWKQLDNPTLVLLLEFYQLTGVMPAANEICSASLLEKLIHGDRDGLPEFGTAYAGEIFSAIRPGTIDDLVIVMNLLHGTGVWEDNMEMLFRAGSITQNEIISSREDLYELLKGLGIGEETSGRILERVRKGKGLKETDNGIISGKVPAWFEESMNKIRYLPSRSTSSIKTYTELALYWYKIHFIELFKMLTHEWSLY
jgi:hypothetical protein